MTAPRYLILHGWQGSGPDHWQSWLAGRLDRVAYPALPDPDAPRLGPWLATLRAELDRADEPVVLCHSLGCVLWMHHAATRPADGPRAGRVLLVAPPCACCAVSELADFFPVDRDPAAIAAAAGRDPPGLRGRRPLLPRGGVRRVRGAPRRPDGPHRGRRAPERDAGYGPWPAVEAWARGERATLAA
jgi:hypothetical protein